MIGGVSSQDAGRERKRVLACAQLIYPDLDVSVEMEGTEIWITLQSSRGVAQRLGPTVLGDRGLGTSVELVEQLSGAAHRLALRTHGKVQPWLYGVDASEAWPVEVSVKDRLPDDGEMVLATYAIRGGPAETRNRARILR